jgi:hypothetical protein
MLEKLEFLKPNPFSASFKFIPDYPKKHASFPLPEELYPP